MANKGQQGNKQVKKPKKDTSPPKPLSSGEPMMPTRTTAIIERGKKKPV